MFAGFGLVAGIWFFAGYYFTTRMAELEHRSSGISTRYTGAQDLLATMRVQMLMGSLYVRDALLDPNPAMAEEYRRQIEESYHKADEALKSYVPIVDDPGEPKRIERLRRELEEFRRTLFEVLSTDNREWPAEARNLLRRRIIPKREMVIHISEEVQTINRSALRSTGRPNVASGRPSASHWPRASPSPSPPRSMQAAWSSGCNASAHATSRPRAICSASRRNC